MPGLDYINTRQRMVQKSARTSWANWIALIAVDSEYVRYGAVAGAAVFGIQKKTPLFSFLKHSLFSVYPAKRVMLVAYIRLCFQTNAVDSYTLWSLSDNFLPTCCIAPTKNNNKKSPPIELTALSMHVKTTRIICRPSSLSWREHGVLCFARRTFFGWQKVRRQPEIIVSVNNLRIIWMDDVSRRMTMPLFRWFNLFVFTFLCFLGSLHSSFVGDIHSH